jgi:hypothetical protein
MIARHAVVFVCRVVAILSSLVGCQFLVTQLDRSFDLQPWCAGDAFCNSWVINCPALLPTMKKCSITTALCSISDQGCIKMNKLLGFDLLELMAMQSSKAKPICMFL